MAKFRETLWFKKGLADEVDPLPLEDSAMLSLGPLRRLPKPALVVDPGDGVTLIAREMTGGRRKLLAVAGASMLGLVAMLAIYAS